MEFCITSIVVIFTGIVVALFWLRRRFSYWERRGVATLSNYVFYRNMKEAILQKNSSSERLLNNYRQFKSLGFRHCGIYLLWNPIYIAMDIEVVKTVMQTDSQYFVDRGIYYDEKNDPLSAHLFSLAGKKWKLLRNKLSPFFTTGQMKMMFDTMVVSAKILNKVLNKELGNAVDIEDVFGRFATDIIGSCAFDLDCKSLENPYSEFRTKGKRFFHRTFFENLKLLLSIVAPQISRMFKMKLTPDEVNEFFMRMVKDHVAYREKNNIFRKDLMQLLIQLKKEGKLVDDEKLPMENMTEQENKITLKEIAAQVFVFFGAGFETSSTAMTFCLYELARNSEIQEKLRSEIKRVMARHNNHLTYEAVMDMNYLEKIINEALRKYPPVVCLTRVCTKEFQLPGTGIVLEKGVRVLIPVYGFHHDPDYYPEPEKFDPERFSSENKRTRPAFTFLPFGDGPRVCIGARFGMMQAKLGIITILLNYKFSVNVKTQEPLQYHTQSFTLSTKGGMWLNFEKITEENTVFCNGKEK